MRASVSVLYAMVKKKKKQQLNFQKMIIILSVFGDLWNQESFTKFTTGFIL